MHSPPIFGPKSISHLSNIYLDGDDFVMCAFNEEGISLSLLGDHQEEDELGVGDGILRILSSIGYATEFSPWIYCYIVSSTFGTDEYDPSRELNLS